MKLLHTSDWHLGKHLETISRIEEQQDVLNEIIDIAEKEEVDAVLVTGDLFDTFNPSVEAIDLFYKTLKCLADNGRRPVVAIAGNHDSPDRIEAPDPLAKECGIIFAGYPNSKIQPFDLKTGLSVINSEEGFLELKLPHCDDPLRILLTPYANEYRLKTYLGQENSEEELRQVLQENWQRLADKYLDEKGINILAAHLFLMKEGTEQPEEPEDEKPVLHLGGAQAIYSRNLPGQLQYAALGHLHRKQFIDTAPCPVVYCGSPLAYSFGEANQDKYVMIADIQPGKEAQVREVELQKAKKLLRRKFDKVDQACEWLSQCDHSIVELTMETDHYLTPDEKKRLYAAHPGLFIIPGINNQDQPAEDKKEDIDLTRNIDLLFSDYFASKNAGQQPAEEIMEIFKEIIAQEVEE
ncbi:MAG: exonuclease subunit SbcD [Bacteroidota bacterium]|nr:exonuclease subunit SbcD [Bacteroidota bacterium]